MRRITLSLAAFAILALSAGAQAKNGPFADKVIFDTRMDQSIAIKDTAEGKADVFLYGMDGKTFKGIGEADRAKLSVYAIPSGSWSIMVNPIPNAAPYSFTAKDGKTRFNPMAIREVRYALNWLIDRKKIVDDILLGAGEPMMTMATPGQPGTYKFNLVPAKLGMTARGNEKRAIADIDAAMKAAAALPENKGKLVKAGQFWNYEGQSVTVKFLIRVDDPTGRLVEGQYIADQIEKAGLKVERLLYDRSKCSKLVYSGDPADWEWSLYTEGWGAGATRAWWDITVSQMYAPYYGYMAGGATAGFWNYENKEIDELAKATYNGWFLTADEYWANNLRIMELALKDSCRIYVASQLQYYAANKASLAGRMLYGLGDGLNGWSIRSAQAAKADAKGQKVLRFTQFSAKGGLFMGAWDPVGVDGFSDNYVAYIYEPASDGMSTFEAPNDAKDTPINVEYDLKNVETKIKAQPGDKPLGLIPVDKAAFLYNSRTKKWESGVEYKDMGEGKMDYVKNDAIVAYTRLAGYRHKYNKWHDGTVQTIADFLYATAFTYDWANKDGEGDKRYDEAYAAQYQSSLAIVKGISLNKDGSCTTYYDFNWPMDKDRVAASGVLSLKAGNPGRNTVVPWTVYEALAMLVAEGSKSGAAYSFSGDPAMVEVDVIQPKCVADIKAKLEDFVAARYVPAYIADYITADQAVARYKAAIKFIDTYGHAYISNGPFFISKVDAVANYIEETAFRDYQYKADYWPNRFKTTLTRIDEVKLPSPAARSKDLTVEVAVSAVTYPDDSAKAADAKAKVTVTLIKADNAELVYPAAMAAPGSFKALIPAKDLGALKPGSYTVVVQSVFAGEAPSVAPGTIVLF